MKEPNQLSQLSQSTLNKHNNQNYQIALEKLLGELERSGERPKLLLQACCAPCSSYVLEYIAGYFDLTVLYYNPNITPEAEYRKRLSELERLLGTADFAAEVKMLPCEYNSDEFFKAVKGMEQLAEGGERCSVCYRLRLEKTACLAAMNGFDYFATTLSVSPYKNSRKLADISMELSEKYGVRWLPNDFKKRGGYQRSIELSKQYGLYRQNYCGCVFSVKQ